jgi:dTDP-4-dehydrorhamnose reductase
MRVLITGASGYLGSYLLRHLRTTGTPVAAWSGARHGDLFGVPLRPVDLADPDAVADAFAEARPDVVLHTAALAKIGDCHRDPARAERVNTRGTAVLGERAAKAGARLVLVSTDLVFDGERGPYREEDEPAPLSVYGRTKAAAEAAVLGLPRTAVVRVSLLFGPSLTDRPSFFDDQVAALRGGRSVSLFADEWRTPLPLHTAAQALFAIALSDRTGLLHLGGPERLSRFEMGRRLAEFLGVSPSSVVAGRREQVAAPEPRPRDTSLDSSRWRQHFPARPWPKYAEALPELFRPS